MMAIAKLALDTNILVDFLDRREFDYRANRLMMIAGKVGEFSLWISSSQVTDLIYILSEGGKQQLIPEVLQRLRQVRTFVNVATVGASEIDKMLASCWKDPEDALLFELALQMRADAIITRNASDFESDAIPVMNCSEFFAWLKESKGVEYAELSA